MIPDMAEGIDWTALADEEIEAPQQLTDEDVDTDNANNDENVDPQQNADPPQIAKDQRQVKRRGRPPKARNDNAVVEGDQAKNRELAKLRDELELVRKENFELRDRLKTNEAHMGNLEDELDVAKGLLLEKEQDYDKLMAEFPTEVVEKPKAVILHDDIAKAIAQKVTSTNVDWQTNQVTIDSLSELSDSELFDEIDLIVLILGTSDVMKGRSVTQILSEIKIACDKLSVSCDILILAAPPNMEKSVQVNLLNHKLVQLQSNGVKFIENPAKGLRSTMLMKDGISLSDKCINAYVDEILTNTKSVTKKSKACKSESRFQVKAVMPLKSEMIGRVIGKGGNVIKKITEESNVSMSLGKWCESSGKGREDSAFDGVLITGWSDNVKRAMDKVTDIINKDSEPVEKKRKV